MLTRDDASVKALEETLRGKLILPFPESDEYDDARELWNLDITELRPAAIIQAQGASDVVAALEFARERKMDVSVAGGRHMVTGRAMKGSLVIDLRLMRSVHIDPLDKVAWVDGGCVVHDVDKESILHSLAAVGGQYHDTGISGFTLGGGMGYLSPWYGLSVDNLEAAEVVMADGTVHVFDDKTDPDLLWALRGAGWAFGVVTRFKIKLHPLPSVGVDSGGRPVHGLGGLVAWPAEHLVPVFGIFRRLHADKQVPRCCQPLVVVASPPSAGIPLVILQYVWLGDIAEGEAFLSKFLDVAPAIANGVAPLHWLAIQKVHSALFPPRHRYYLATYYSDDKAYFDNVAGGGSGSGSGGSGPSFEDQLDGYLERHPRPANCFFAAVAPGYRVEEIAPDATAYYNRQSRVMFLGGVQGEPKTGGAAAREDSAAQEELKEEESGAKRRNGSHSGGGAGEEEDDFSAGIHYLKTLSALLLKQFIREEAYYPNLNSSDATAKGVAPPSRRGSCYGPNLDRLLQLKRRYDPDNVFHHAKLA